MKNAYTSIIFGIAPLYAEGLDPSVKQFDLTIGLTQNYVSYTNKDRKSLFLKAPECLTSLSV